ncbi:MAG: hypothetical protein WD200_02635 [Candidatus Andersenbacteria bacterium]
MKTLLEKVQTIEEEATATIQKAESGAKQDLNQVQSSEERVVEELRKKAENTARAIIDEQVRSARDEINKIKQEQAHSVEMVHSAAARNRADALQKAHHLFEEEYLK